MYDLLAPGDEPALIQAAVPAGATLLELGAGAGRITKPLVAAGYRVTAVDESPEMLARLGDSGAERALAKIEDLDLHRLYGGVLLMSHLINTPDEALRRAFLSCCRRHLAAHGVLVLQRHPPDWFERAAERQVMDGEVRIRLRAVSRPTSRTVKATVQYEHGGQVWTQTFTAACLDDRDVQEQLAAAGLDFVRWLDADRSWCTARPAPVQAG